MQYLTKSLLVASVFAIAGAAAVQADDQQLTNRLAIQNAQSQRETSVAVYADNGSRGAGKNYVATTAPEAATTYEFRPNGHGQLIGLYRQAE